MKICTIKYTHPQSPWGKGVENGSIGFPVCWVKDMIREREGRQIEVYYQTMACVVQESDTEKEGKNMLSDLQPSVAY